MTAKVIISVKGTVVLIPKSSFSLELLMGLYFTPKGSVSLPIATPYMACHHIVSKSRRDVVVRWQKHGQRTRDDGEESQSC